MLHVSVNGKYQLEVNLKYFRNPSGRLINGSQCDNTVPQDTCDTMFVIYAQNFKNDQRVIGARYVIGVYQNMNDVKFGRCLPGYIENPLKFIFSGVEHNIQVHCTLLLNVL